MNKQKVLNKPMVKDGITMKFGTHLELFIINRKGWYGCLYYRFTDQDWCQYLIEFGKYGFWPWVHIHIKAVVMNREYIKW
jgi:hypothetical protein